MIHAELSLSHLGTMLVLKDPAAGMVLLKGLRQTCRYHPVNICRHVNDSEDRSWDDLQLM